jgi:hypothetical protein
MTSRWRRICALFCAVMTLHMGAAMAQESAEAVDETADAVAEAAADTVVETTAEPAQTEQIIDQGTLPETIQKLLETAVAEIGYTEGNAGYSKYGAWAGDPYSEWCAEFVCWCVNMTDKLYGYELLNNVYPYYTGQNTGRDWFITRGRFVFRKGYQSGWGWQWLKSGDGMMAVNDYIPLPGDFVYFSYDSAGDTAHVALVEYCAYAADGSVNIHVIEGNNPDSVQRAVYPLNNSQILGFGCRDDVVDTTMQYGNTGDKVLQLQQDLGSLGYLTSQNFTGTYASNTRNAVTAFQQNMAGKTPTGVADRDTQIAIQNEIEKLAIDDPDSWLVVDGN